MDNEIIKTIEPDRETMILERILTLKQLRKDGLAGPLELHELAICYYNLGNFRQGAEYLQNLMEDFPDYVEIAAVQSLRVLCLIMDGHFEEAEKILEERLRMQNQDTRLMAMLAHIQEKSGRAVEAIGTHRKILRVDPDNINSLNNLGYLLTLHGGMGDRQEAFACLKKAVSKNPDHPAYLDSLGVFLARSGQTDQAKKALMKALKRLPENAEILDHLKELVKTSGK